MSGIDFYQTVMGRAFYDGTMPKLAEAMERIASALETLVELERAKLDGDARDRIPQQTEKGGPE